MDFKRPLRWIILLALYGAGSSHLHAQDLLSKQIEEQDQINESTEEDLNKLIGVEPTKRKNINNASFESLQALGILTIIQINSFFEYKREMGDFVSIYELQAIPNWDIPLIKEVMKWYVPQLISDARSSGSNQAEQQLLFRIGRSGSSRTLEHSYTRGLKQTLFYRYNNPLNTSIGLSAEKDAGEKNILDFTSGYIQKEHFSVFKKIIAGDYLLSMGQGMIQWQGYAFGKGSNIMSIMRQPPHIKPHTGTEENRFFRGMAFETGQRNTQFYCFISKKGLDANIIMDSASKQQWVSSLQLTGLHRNESEMEDRKSLKTFHTGFIVKHHLKSGHIALNGIYTHLNTPIQKRALPYNTYSIKGDEWYNISGDFILSTKLGTAFGEMAIDKQFSTGTLFGFLKNLNRKVDIGLQWRNISKSYNAFSPNIVAHQSVAGNERGLYLGINLKLNNRDRLETFVDRFIHPFPVFSANGPQRGITHALTYAVNPTKKWDIYIRVIQKRKIENTRSNQSKSFFLSENQSLHLRIHAGFHINEAMELRIRNELLSRKDGAGNNCYGWLTYAELIFHPILQSYSISMRTTYFNTDGFDAAIYSMERDIPHYYAMNSYFNRGNSSYLLFQTKITNQIHFAGKWAIEKKYFPSHNTTSHFNALVQSSWRLQATIKF